MESASNLTEVMRVVAEMSNSEAFNGQETLSFYMGMKQTVKICLGSESVVYQFLKSTVECYLYHTD